ncbi:MAG: transporter-related protein [Chlorobi bacterium]|nr:transporter-related protein [Chlorobiota bacterium]
MSIISLENVSKDFGVGPLFQEVTFGLEAGERVGLIGSNGAGKTTLLRIIAGDDQPDRGRVMRGGNPVVSYLSQNPPFDPEGTVLDAIYAASTETMRMLHDYEAACNALSTHDGDDTALMARISELGSELEAIGAWSLETEAKIILDRLGISDTSAKMGTLSGGQRKRVALAHALIERPDLLILDEPTNHLDVDTIAWLESYLARYTGALLLVTHDRYFLDRVTNRILEIDRGRVQGYTGGYAYFLEKKDEQELRLEVEGRKREALIRQELAWLRRGAKARTTKQKARIDRAENLMAQPKEKKKEEMDISVGSRRLGSRIIEMHNVSKSYDGKKLLDGFTYTLQRGDRIGIIGPNGSGKTTLLDIITGRVEADSGRADIGETVVIGYYDQESRALDTEMRVIEYIREVADNITTADGSLITASQMLERFLFPPAMQYGVIGKLSGGERRRLYLLRLLMGTPNVLILDEPTNDLDIETLQTMEDYLEGFGGCLIVVSHDRYFLDRTVDHIFRFDGEGRVREYPGNYSAYLEITEREAAEAAAAAQPPKPAEVPKQTQTKSDPSARKLSYKERQELGVLETRIAAAEGKKRDLEEKIAALGSDYVAVRDRSEELQKLLAGLERDMERWAELAEFA